MKKALGGGRPNISKTVQRRAIIHRETITCPLCEKDPEVKEPVELATVLELQDHFINHHWQIHGYACQCCGAMFATAEELAKNHTECDEFAEWLAARRNSNEQLKMAAARMMMCCSDCGWYTNLGERGRAINQPTTIKYLKAFFEHHNNDGLLSILIYFPAHPSDELEAVRFPVTSVTGGDPLAPCAHCNPLVHFRDPSEANAHYMKEHKDKALECEVCKAKTTTAYLLGQHLMEHVHENSYLADYLTNSARIYPPKQNLSFASRCGWKDRVDSEVYAYGGVYGGRGAARGGGYDLVDPFDNVRELKVRLANKRRLEGKSPRNIGYEGAMAQEESEMARRVREKLMSDFGNCAGIREFDDQTWLRDEDAAKFAEWIEYWESEEGKAEGGPPKMDVEIDLTSSTVRIPSVEVELKFADSDVISGFLLNANVFYCTACDTIVKGAQAAEHLKPRNKDRTTNLCALSGGMIKEDPAENENMTLLHLSAPETASPAAALRCPHCEHTACSITGLRVHVMGAHALFVKCAPAAGENLTASLAILMNKRARVARRTMANKTPAPIQHNNNQQPSSSKRARPPSGTLQQPIVAGPSMPQVTVTQKRGRPLGTYGRRQRAVNAAYRNAINYDDYDDDVEVLQPMDLRQSEQRRVAAVARAARTRPYTTAYTAPRLPYSSLVPYAPRQSYPPRPQYTAEQLAQATLQIRQTQAAAEMRRMQAEVMERKTPHAATAATRPTARGLPYAPRLLQRQLAAAATRNNKRPRLSESEEEVVRDVMQTMVNRVVREEDLALAQEAASNEDDYNERLDCVVDEEHVDHDDVIMMEVSPAVRKRSSIDAIVRDESSEGESVVGGANEPGYIDDSDEVVEEEDEGRGVPVQPMIREFQPDSADDDLCVVAEVENFGSANAAVTKNNQREKKVNCPRCSLKFITQAAVREHLAKAHETDAGAATIDEELGIPLDAKVFICRNCCIAFQTMQAKQAHAVKHGVVHGCETCSGFSYNDAVLEQHHEKLLEKRLAYICGECMLSFENETCLHEHSNVKHGVPLFYFCKSCEIGSMHGLEMYSHFMMGQHCAVGFQQRKRTMGIQAAQEAAWRSIGVVPASQLHFQPDDLLYHKKLLAAQPDRFVMPNLCPHRSMLVATDRLITCNTCKCLNNMHRHAANEKHATGTEFDPKFTVVTKMDPPLARLRQEYMNMHTVGGQRQQQMMALQYNRQPAPRPPQQQPRRIAPPMPTQYQRQLPPPPIPQSGGTYDLAGGGNGRVTVTRGVVPPSQRGVGREYDGANGSTMVRRVYPPAPPTARPAQPPPTSAAYLEAHRTIMERIARGRGGAVNSPACTSTVRGGGRGGVVRGGATMIRGAPAFADPMRGRGGGSAVGGAARMMQGAHAGRGGGVGGAAERMMQGSPACTSTMGRGNAVGPSTRVAKVVLAPPPQTTSAAVNNDLMSMLARAGFHFSPPSSPPASPPFIPAPRPNQLAMTSSFRGRGGPSTSRSAATDVVPPHHPPPPSPSFPSARLNQWTMTSGGGGVGAATSTRVPPQSLPSLPSTSRRRTPSPSPYVIPPSSTNHSTPSPLNDRKPFA